MKISCETGYYKFYPESLPALSTFRAKYGVELVQVRDFYTFEALANMQTYYVQGQLIGIGLAKKTMAGDPWKILKDNLLCYNLALSNISELALAIAPNNPRVSDLYVFDEIPQSCAIMTADGRAYHSFYGEIDFNSGLVKVETFYDPLY